MSSLDLTLWIPILATWVLAIGTLVFAYWQLRQSQRLHSATTLLDLRERFYSPRLQRSRRSFSAWLLQTDRKDEPTDWEVTFFLELLGSLTRAGDLSPQLVRSAFDTWVSAYYVCLTRPVNYIDRWRQEDHDDSIFADFEWLARRVLEQDHRVTPEETPAEELERCRYLLQGETRLEGLA